MSIKDDGGTTTVVRALAVSIFTLNTMTFIFTIVKYVIKKELISYRLYRYR